MSFSHIERLHGMIYAYGATVVEIVRRKEFCEFCLFTHTPSFSLLLLLFLTKFMWT